MKKFKEFTSLLETPLMNDYLSKDKMDLLANHTKQRITSSTSPESKINNFYHKVIDGDHMYYTKNNEGVNSVSVISPDNIHLFTHKGSEPASQIHSFMTHHSEKHGQVKTDLNNTEGSKKLWTTLIKSKPVNKSFHMTNPDIQDKISIDHNNIDSMSDKIWGKRSKFSDVKLVMTHHD